MHIHTREDEYSFEGQVGALLGEYGAQVDFERTMPIVARHGLVFWLAATVAGVGYVGSMLTRSFAPTVWLRSR